MLISRLIGPTVPTRTRLGFSLGLIVLLTIIGNEVIQRISFLRQYFEISSFVLVLAGFIIWLIGHSTATPSEEQDLVVEITVTTEFRRGC